MNFLRNNFAEIISQRNEQDFTQNSRDAVYTLNGIYSVSIIMYDVLQSFYTRKRVCFPDSFPITGTDGILQIPYQEFVIPHVQ